VPSVRRSTLPARPRLTGRCSMSCPSAPVSLSALELIGSRPLVENTSGRRDAVSAPRPQVEGQVFVCCQRPKAKTQVRGHGGHDIPECEPSTPHRGANNSRLTRPTQSVNRSHNSRPVVLRLLWRQLAARESCPWVVATRGPGGGRAPAWQ